MRITARQAGSRPGRVGSRPGRVGSHPVRAWPATDLSSPGSRPGRPRSPGPRLGRAWLASGRPVRAWAAPGSRPVARRSVPGHAGKTEQDVEMTFGDFGARCYLAF